MATPPDASFFDVSQDAAVQALSHSFTVAELLRKTPKQRLASTLTKMRSIYGRSRESPNTSSKSTLRLNVTYSHVPSRLTTGVRKKSLKPDIPAVRKVPSARFLSDICCNTEICKSDFLELKRDIATYEHCFLTSASSLPALDELSEFVPQVIRKSQEADAEKRSTASVLHAAVEQLSRIAVKTPPSEVSCFQKVEFEVKKPSAHYRLRTVFRGCRQVSGSYCLLHVRSNGWLTAFEITGLLQDGLPVALKLSHSIPGLSTDSDAAETARRLDCCLLKKLYLTVLQDRMALCFHARSGVDFLEFPVWVRSKGLVRVRVEEGRVLIPQLEDFPAPHPVDISRLKAHIERSVHFLPAKSQLLWQDAATRFSAKEAESRLMSAAYVTEKLGSFVNRHSFVTECEVGGRVFSVELLTRGHREKVVVATEGCAREVKDTKLLRALQFTNFATSWVTFMHSLELQITIRKLFAEMF